MISSKNRLFVSFYKKNGSYLRYSVLPAVEQLSKYPSVKTKSKKSPFMKNIFLGKFDKSFLSYPEILNDVELKDIEERVSKFKTLLQDENEDRKTMFEELVKSGILKLQSPLEYGGIEVTNTHLIKTCDLLNLKPTEALLLDLHRSLILDTLYKYGSTPLKEKYINKILNGEIFGAYAMSEHSSGSDPSSIKTKAVLTNDIYTITGEKTWVTNGKKADFFIVFAQIPTQVGNSENNDLAAFIIDKDDTISYSDVDSTALTETGLCHVKFNQTQVSSENMISTPNLGYSIAAHSLQTSQNFISTCILNSLKDIILETTKFIQKRKQFFKDLKDSQHILSKLGKICMNVYAMESMIYLISGANDQHIIDTSLETAIIHIFAYEKCINSIKTCLNLLGGTGFNEVHSKLFKDIQGLTYLTKTTDIIKLYIAMNGIEHAGLKKGKDIKQSRNPLDFPNFYIKKIISDTRQRKDDPKLKQELYSSIHPSLKTSAEQLEYCVYRLDYAVEQLLIRHGSSIVEQQLDLIRVANIAVNILAMTSVLSRASRSYCTGIRFSDDELYLARAYCQDCTVEVKKDAMDVIEGALYSNDLPSLKLGSQVIKNSGYFIEHPTVKNIH